jgi:glycosyltransferase involved in cell wall biosynthesis
MANPPFRRRRVLVSAFAVSPVRGSEPGIGWNIGSRLAQYHDVTLMCVPGIVEPRRKEIEAYLREHGPISGLNLLFVEETFLSRVLDFSAGPLSSSLLRPLFYVGYASWQRAAYRKAKELHAQAPFELSHHLNMLGYREPGYLWKLPIPFFWGPVAGASNMPWPFFRMLSWRDRLAYGLRNLANEIQKRLFGRPRHAARAAAHIWAIGEDNRRMFADLFGVPAECLCESGGKPEPHAASVKTYDAKTEPLRLVFAGLHIGRKGVPILLHAIARLGNEFPVALTCLGDGPERLKWQNLSRRLGIAEKVTWAGKLPHAEALAEMAKAHVFAFPSMQEASSTVTLEALSLGLPVVCHDACGMSFIVNGDCGFKVPLHSPETSSEGFATALRHLHRHPEDVTRLSKGALRRSEELSWDYAAQQIAEGYDRVLSARVSGKVAAPLADSMNSSAGH